MGWVEKMARDTPLYEMTPVTARFHSYKLMSKREFLMRTIDFARRMQNGFVYNFWTPYESGAMF